jgi:hypothetical protein
MQQVQFHKLQQGCLKSFPPTGADPKSDRITRIEIPSLNRLQAIGAISDRARNRVEDLIDLAKRGLPRMHRRGAFASRLRAVGTGVGRSVRREGDSLRCQAIVALGLAGLDKEAQRQILDGNTAADLAHISATRAEICDDTGAIALAAWAAAEAAGISAAPLFRRLGALLAADTPIATEDCAWLLAAAVAAGRLEYTSELAGEAVRRLVASQGASGLFPSMLPASSPRGQLTQVGCFADQVHAIQALARVHAAYGDMAALAAAEACAARICELQGGDGQWWWRYDVRDGSVIETYPVYSVHQHAMGPMALIELREAGGRDRWDAVVKGLDWLHRHPEFTEPLISGGEASIWRKGARRGPACFVRAVSAAMTCARPGLRLALLDRFFPPNRVDHECRPCDLGWLFYAWLSGGCIERLRDGCRR